MPTYAYVCTACDHSFEAVQAITDDSLSECPSCGGALRKKFHPVGVTFKGSGFYRTDSRGGAGGTAKDSDTGAAASDSKDKGAGSKDSSGSEASKSSSDSSSSSGSSSGSGSSGSSSGSSGSSSGSSSSKPSTS